MKKHKFNIFPEAKAEDYARLLDDIRANGFDPKQPVTLYESEVLDGWNRTKACAEIGIQPPTVAFTGTDADAIAFVMRTNKRRNLSPAQWACIAQEAEDLLAAIAEKVENERREKQAEAQKLSDKKLSDTPKPDPRARGSNTDATSSQNYDEVGSTHALAGATRNLRKKLWRFQNLGKSGKLLTKPPNSSIPTGPTSTKRRR
jgi:hypothetical protein